MEDDTITTGEAIAWLDEAAKYFAGRPTGGEDIRHWSNVSNAENARRIADLLRAMALAHATPQIDLNATRTDPAQTP